MDPIRLQIAWKLLIVEESEESKGGTGLNVRITDVTSHFPPTPSVLAGYTIHVVGERVVLIGGGGVFYWMPHFNTSCTCKTPTCIEFPPSSCTLRNGVTQPHREYQMKRETPQEESQWMLHVTDSKLVHFCCLRNSKVKQVKTFLEEKQLYDKTRRITRLEDHSFGVPVKNPPDFRQLTENAPTAIQPIFSSGPTIIPSVKPSNSLPDQIRILFESFCTNHEENWNSQSVLYRRSEIVGNILVFSRVSFSGEKSSEFWNELTEIPSVLSKAPLSSEWTSFFHQLIELTKCNRIGIHHEIDCGPKRQSHSRIIYSEVEAEDGWVTLRQVAFIHRHYI